MPLGVFISPSTKWVRSSPFLVLPRTPNPSKALTEGVGRWNTPHQDPKANFGLSCPPMGPNPIDATLPQDSQHISDDPHTPHVRLIRDLVIIHHLR